MIRRPPRSTPFPYTTLCRSDLLHQRQPHALRRPAVDLPHDRVRVDRLADVLRRVERDHLHQAELDVDVDEDRKSTRLNSSHANISYAVFCLKKKKYLNSQHM